MKIILASYLEPENFGKGRLLSIVDSKPEELETDGIFYYFVPNQDSLKEYFRLKLIDPKKAAIKFEQAFENQLNRFVEHVNVIAAETNSDVFSLLPFVDGDTLLSWERNKNANYRHLVADCLKKMGYDVECY